MIKIAVDAMGGDNAPGEIVKGAVDAVTERKDITVCLTGQKDVIEKELSKYTYKIDSRRGLRRNLSGTFYFIFIGRQPTAR